MSFTGSLDDIVAQNRNGLLGVAAGWSRARLGDVASVLNGFPFPSSRFSKTKGTPLLRIRDVLDGQTETLFDGPFAPEYLVQRGDLLVGMDGDFNAARWQGEPALLNQRVCKLTPEAARLDVRFLALVLPGYLSAVNAETSSITVKHLSSKTILELPIPLPPLPVQQTLVSEIERQFTRLDVGVAALKRLQAHLQRYRAAVLRAASEGTLGGDVSASGANTARMPSKWNLEPLGSVLSQIQSGKSFRCDERPPTALEVGVVKVSAVTWGTFDEEESKTCKDDSRIDDGLLIRDGDFLFSRANTINLVGTCVIVESVRKRLMLSDKILRFSILGAEPRWVMWMLRSPWGRSEVERLATGNQESMRNIGQDRIRQIRLPMPPLHEQRRQVGLIEQALSTADSAEAMTAKCFARSAGLRASVLREAFAGRLTT